MLVTAISENHQVCPLLRRWISLAILIAATCVQNRRYLACDKIRRQSPSVPAPTIILKSSITNYSTKQISRFPRMTWDRIVIKIAGKIAKCATACSDEIRCDQPIKSPSLSGALVVSPGEERDLNPVSSNSLATALLPVISVIRRLNQYLLQMTSFIWCKWGVLLCC